MTTADNLTTSTALAFDLDDLLTAASTGRLWRALVKRPGSGKLEVAFVVADEAAPWTAGVLYFWNRGHAKGERRSVRAFAPGHWTSFRSQD